MNRNIKNSVAAAVVLMAMAPAANAGGVQIDNSSLTDVLVQKGILTKDEAKAVSKNADGKLKLEALLYLNTFYQKADTTAAGATTSVKSYGTNVDRAYFTAKYNFNDDWMMRITTDMGTDNALGSKRQNIYLKYAYVEGKLVGNAAVLRLGQSHTPWIDYEQDLWKHRYVAKTMIDTYGFDSSADLGVGLKGKLADGMVQYWLTETTGRGYGNSSYGASGNSNGADFDSRIGFYPMEGLTVDFQFRDGYKGSKTSTPANGDVKSTLWQAMISYGSEHDWRIGANYVSNNDKMNKAGNIAGNAAATSSGHGGNVSSGLTLGAASAVGDKVESRGTALWAWAKVPGTDFGGFARYENLTNQATTAGVKGNKEKVTRYVLGLEYNVTKGIDFSLVYDGAKLTDRGGVAGNERKDARYGLYSQVKF